METMLSRGCLEINCEYVPSQGYKLLQMPTGPERYRLMLTDGESRSSSVMLATQLNHLVVSGKITENRIVRLQNYNSTELRDGRRLILVLELEVLNVEGVQQEGVIEDKQATVGQAITPQRNSEVIQDPLPSPTFSGHSRPPNLAALGSPDTPGSQGRCMPIASLNPYQNRWKICVRVINKSDIRRWSNARGEGRFFTVDMVDESGEIRAIAFNDECDKFFAQLEINKIYYLSKGVLRTANKKFNTIRHDYEIAMASQTVVALCEDALVTLPQSSFQFIPIAKLDTLPKDSLVDVMGVCQSCEDLTTVVLRSSGREVMKRQVHLVDESGKAVSATMWGKEAEQFSGTGLPVLAIRGARLSDYGGCSLSLITSSTLMLNPDIPAAFQLRAWYDQMGSIMDVESISIRKGSMSPWTGANVNWKTFSAGKDYILGASEQPDYYTAKGTVIFVKRESYLYKACSIPDCNKKLVSSSNGSYRCERCAREDTKFKYRLFLQVNLADVSDNQWVTCFHETAETILGQTAEKIGAWKEQGNEEAIENVFHEATFKSYIFRLRVKMEHYNDEARLKAVMVDVHAIDHCEYGRKLIMDIRNMAA
uniref:replication protein A 70 kDa DNA-binding subunit-like n=1 Tax=Myxine glutinosa TaxID=7769 RepID=UPI00358FDBA4